jgi:hypothetical protein
MTSENFRIQFSISEREFMLKNLQCDQSDLLNKIRQATPLAKLKSYRECFLTTDEFQSLASAVRYEAKNNKKKQLAVIAQEILETLHSLWDSHKR